MYAFSGTAPRDRRIKALRTILQDQINPDSALTWGHASGMSRSLAVWWVSPTQSVGLARLANHSIKGFRKLVRSGSLIIYQSSKKAHRPAVAASRVADRAKCNILQLGAAHNRKVMACGGISLHWVALEGHLPVPIIVAPDLQSASGMHHQCSCCSRCQKLRMLVCHM